MIPDTPEPFISFLVDLSANILGTLIGAGIGFWSALKLNSLAQKQAEKEKIKSRMERHTTALQLVIQELEQNEEPLKNLSSDLESALPLSYNFSIHIWKTISSEILEALGTSTEASKKVSAAYYYLDQLNLVLAQYSNLITRGGRDYIMGLTTYKPIIQDYQSSAEANIIKAKNNIQKVLQELKQ